MSQAKWNTQNWFTTTLTSGIPANSSDGSFTVASAPQGTRGYIVISANDDIQQETIYFYNRVGSTIYYRGVDRGTPREHFIGDVAALNNVANYFNELDDYLGRAFKHELVGGLVIKIFGESILVGDEQTTIADASLTLTNNTTSYIYVDYTDDTIKSTTTIGTANLGHRICDVVTSGGNITSVTRVPAFQIDNRFDPVKFERGTNGYWGMKELYLVETASNTGTVGTGVYKQKTATDLEFYKLNANDTKIGITLNGTDRIDFTIDDTEIDHDLLKNYDIDQHRIINDAGISATELWSSNKISLELGDKAALNHTHTASQVTDFTTESQTIWDNKWALKTTDNLPEGASKFYFSTTRFNNALAAKTSDDIAQGVSNLYFNSTTFNTYFSAKTTDDLDEGALNGYYTTVKFDLDFSNSDLGDLAVRDYADLSNRPADDDFYTLPASNTTALIDYLAIYDTSGAAYHKITVADFMSGITGLGEANTASNQGTVGTGIFKQKTGVDLEFYKVNSANSLLTIALNGTDRVDFTVNQGSIDHGSIAGLSDDDHTQYVLATGTRDLSGVIKYTAHPTFNADTQLVDKKYVDDSLVGLGNVFGPATNTDGYIPQWNGLNSKTLKNGLALDTDGTLAANSDTSIATQKAVKTYTDGLVAGLLDYRGGYDASGNTYPATGGSGTAGAVMKGDTWVISVAGTLGGSAISIGDSIIANVDSPGQTAGNWNSLNSNISYVPEDQANKVTSISGASTNTQYPSAKLIYDQLALKGNDNAIVHLAGAETITGLKKFDDSFYGKQIATPANPDASYNKLYFKSDNKLYSLTSGGVETEVGSGAGFVWGSSITGSSGTGLTLTTTGTGKSIICEDSSGVTHSRGTFTNGKIFSETVAQPSGYITTKLTIDSINNGYLLSSDCVASGTDTVRSKFIYGDLTKASVNASTADIGQIYFNENLTNAYSNQQTQSGSYFKINKYFNGTQRVIDNSVMMEFNYGQHPTTPGGGAHVGGGIGIILNSINSSGKHISLQDTGTEYASLHANVADGASVVGYLFGTKNVLSTSGAKVASFKNSTTEVFSIDKAGIVNVPTGGEYRINGTEMYVGGNTTKNIGYLNIPQNSQSAAYTTVLGDSGKHILHPSADTTARTFTIDSNANVAYPIGTAITFINQNSAGALTIAITSDTMRLAGAGTTGNRTLAANGVATAIKITSTEWIISGTGLS